MSRSDIRCRTTYRVLTLMVIVPFTIATCNSREAADVPPAPLVLDAHADIENPLETPNRADTYDVGSPVELARLERGGVDAIMLSVHAPQGPRTAEGVAIAGQIAHAKLEAIRAIAERHPTRAAMATTAEDVRRIAASGRIAIVLTMISRAC